MTVALHRLQAQAYRQYRRLAGAAAAVGLEPRFLAEMVVQVAAVQQQHIAQRQAQERLVKVIMAVREVTAAHLTVVVAVVVQAA
jgi:hypothetical protein